MITIESNPSSELTKEVVPNNVESSNSNHGSCSNLPFLQAFHSIKNGGKEVEKNQFLQFMKNKQIMNTLLAPKLEGNITLQNNGLQFNENNLQIDDDIHFNQNNLQINGDSDTSPQSNGALNGNNGVMQGIENSNINGSSQNGNGETHHLIPYSLLQYPIPNDQSSKNEENGDKNPDDEESGDEDFIGNEMDIDKLSEAQKQEILNITRPPNQFFIFCEANRSDIKKKNPNMAPREVTKLLSKSWKDLSESERNVFKFQAEDKKKKIFGKVP